MDYYKLTFGSVTRQLPIVALGPKKKVASFNILGDKELVATAARQLLKKVDGLEFNCLVGPEITVLPLIHELAHLMDMPRYVIMRKQIHGYMQRPVVSDQKPGLVLNGADADFLMHKKVLIVDDIVSTGRTIGIMNALLQKLDVQVVGTATILKQGEEFDENIKDLMYLEKVPLFSV